MRLLAVLAACACAPVIPSRHLDVHPTSAATTLAPCALVHYTEQASLSDAARGSSGDFEVAYTTFVIRTARGVVLIDAAIGATVAADLDAAPFWFRWQFSGVKAAKPLAAMLAEIGVKPEDVTHVLLTHAHWDHTGGLAQLPRARVVMADDWILAEHGALTHASMPHHFDSVRDRVDLLAFRGPALDGFAASQDVFGDGSVIALPTPGHTPGSTSYLVGGKWLFIGDAAWAREGFEKPALKGRLASAIVDADSDQTADTLGTLHALWESHVATLVTAHDPRTWDGIPRCK